MLIVSIAKINHLIFILQDSKDSLARLGECFVRMQIDQITADDSDFGRDELRKFVYNPNEVNEPDLNLMNLFKPLADAVIESTKKEGPMDSPDSQRKGQEIRDKFSNIFHKVSPVSHDRFRQILIQNSNRYDNAMNDRKSISQKFQEIENVINAVCHPKTVDSACQLYLQQIRNEISKTNNSVIK